ncbi:MAG: hypothetical protein ACTSWA_11425 [Candidatus Thorarchaeota archaeon]
MRKPYLILLSTIVLSMLFLMGTASAQSDLVANIPRTDEHIWGATSNSYVADLEEGHWTVIVDSDSFWDLQVKLTIAEDSSFSTVIAESATEVGNFPRVDFTLNASSTVYIRVSENSVYHETSGFYKIGVYDDSHIPGFFESLSFLDWVILFSVLSVVLPLICGGLACRRSRRQVSKIQDTILVDAPMHAIPKEHYESVQTHGSHTTTVRLPLKCPSCGGEVSHEGVDWVGPLEAKCGYCGSTLRATFERL